MQSLTLNPLLVEIGAPALLAGLILGALVTWLILGRRQRQLEATIKNQEALQHEREIAFEAAKSQLTSAFSDLANQTLKSNSETFLRLAEQNLGTQQERAKRDLGEREKAIEELVKPIRDSLQAAQKQITELEKSRSEAYGGIKSQLEAMRISQQSLTQETQNLVKALRRPEVRGRWGEITLRRLVELAGMVEHCDFQEQVHSVGDDKVIRPDMIVRMPDQRELVVDVKTPLDAYLEAVEAKDDAQRKLGLQRHTRNLREHIRTLASKSYWAQFTASPEFVILFIPGDQFLSAALNEDPDLIEYALSQQIILATPTSFVALLKAVAYGWRQLALADNAQEIRQLAEDLYGRLATFVTHMNRVGRQLASSVENYNRAVGSLERKVLPGARKFTELGIHPKKELEKLETLDPVPRTMIENSDDDDDPIVSGELPDKTLQ
ncbi:DNA recombination protein RmuC [Gammaproteobacteria bacterium]|jgi:DNA recombination protein RmuC|nr:DNA recombination protein RmuC [Gammaproteobacteria bacterium]